MALSKLPIKPVLCYVRPAKSRKSIILAVQPHGGADLDQYKLDSKQALNLALEILKQIQQSTT